VRQGNLHDGAETAAARIYNYGLKARLIPEKCANRSKPQGV